MISNSWVQNVVENFFLAIQVKVCVALHIWLWRIVKVMTEMPERPNRSSARRGYSDLPMRSVGGRLIINVSLCSCLVASSPSPLSSLLSYPLPYFCSCFNHLYNFSFSSTSPPSPHHQMILKFSSFLLFPPFPPPPQPSPLFFPSPLSPLSFPLSPLLLFPLLQLTTPIYTVAGKVQVNL